MPSTTSAADNVHPTIASEATTLAKTRPIALHGREALSQPYRFVVELSDPLGQAPDWDGLGTAWLNKQVTVDLAPLDPTSDRVNTIHGIVAAAELLGTTGDPNLPAHYRIEIVPKLWLLSLTRRTRVFTDQSVLDVVKSVLQAGGVAFTLRASAGKMANSSNLPHLTQYDESDLDFISRLLEDQGICYWFEHGANGSTMILANDAGHFPGPDAAVEVTADGAEMHDLHQLGLRVALVPSETRSSDYDHNDPSTARSGSKTIPANRAPVRQGSWTVLNSAWVSGGPVADAVATIEADRLISHASTFHGVSQDIRFRAGRRVKLPTSPCLVVEVEHQWRDTAYSNRFAWVGWAALPWRPARLTPRPRLDAPVPGVVSATAGDQGGQDEAALDGSYRVKLIQAGDAGDRVMRLAQPYGGGGRGLHFPLPPDTEVLLSHIDGHPDRPVIASAAPNINNPGPIADANRTQCKVQTASGHSLVFEDKDGEEQITLAGKGGNTLAFAEASGSEKITLTATKDHEVSVAGDSKTAVTGKTDIDCQDEITITAIKKVTLKVGSASIVIDSAGKITVDGVEIAVKGSAGVKVESTASLEAKGATVTIASDGPLEAKGATMKLDGGGMLEAKGGIIKLN